MNISVKELKKILDSKKIHLIDIRSEAKYQSGTIPGARHIFENDLLYHVSQYLNKEEEYYIFCESGSVSSMVCNLLRSMGYQAYNVVGGYQKYLADEK